MNELRPTTVSVWQRLRTLSAHHQQLLVLVSLLAIEVLLFGAVASKVGFYLDDWDALCIMKQAPHNVFGLFTYYFQHGAHVINRPVQILHFGSLFLLAGTKPLFYHLFNGALEIIGAWLLYRSINRLTQSPSFAWIAAALFLVSPIHDSTHYWVLSSSVTLSLVLWLLSVDWTINAVERQKQAWLFAAVTSFGLSLFNYEVFLPLVSANVAIVFLITRRAGAPLKEAIAKAASVAAVFAIPVALFVGYQKLVPLLMPVAWVHAPSINVGNIAQTVVQGLGVSLSAKPFAFGSKLIIGPAASIEAAAVVRTIAIAALTAVVALVLPSGNPKSRTLVVAGLAGIALVCTSYTIFGLSTEYQPTLDSIVNRINDGAALGASIVFAAALVLLAQAKPMRVLSRCTAGAGLLALTAFFCLVDNAMSQPWIVSEKMHRHIIRFVQANAPAIKNSEALLLADCPHYVNWAPVFDGVWDFQNLVRVSLNDYRVNAGVVTERMHISPDHVTDVASGYVCGRYPTQNLLLLDAPHSRLIPINSSRQFIDAVNQYGLGFDFDRTALTRWRQELVAESTGTN